MATTALEPVVRLPKPHDKQRAFRDSPAKRKVIVAGRRGGKTTGAAIMAVEAMIRGRRVLEAAPTHDQTAAFWTACQRSMTELIDAGIVARNRTERTLEMPSTGGRIRAKTAHDADSLRGDYADLLILDEFSLMDATAWTEVGAPMLLDNNGDAVFIFTPKGGAKLAREMFQRGQTDESGRWASWHFTSLDNPHISVEALGDITQDMTQRGYRQEILAEWLDDVPGALWTRSMFESRKAAPDLARVVIAVDPAATAHEESDNTGIVAAGKGVDGRGYVLADRSCRLSPDGWARRAVAAYHEFGADRIVAEGNNGGEMVRHVIQTVDPKIKVVIVHASRGKIARAEPVAALYEQGKVTHTTVMDDLEDELCTWTPESGASPDRLDALVWAITDLMITGRSNKLVTF
jgi:predicted phage terminase large subunit-like protein